MEEIFQTVSAWVRDSDPSDGETTSTDERLSLYGLYKHATTGPCPGDALPPVYQLKARTKYQAWEACQSYTKEEAMENYIKLLASRNDDLGVRCKALLDDFHQQQDMSEVGSSWEAAEDNFSSPKGEDARRLPDTDATTMDSQSNTPNLHSPAIDLLVLIFSLPLRLFGIRAMIPRGKLDISFLDLFFALYQCLRWKGLQGRCSAMIKQIQDIWENSTGCDVAVGFSVRSLFDLYLTSKQYPQNAEVVVFPPITVPGMIHVAKCHDLKLVPVDIGESTWWNGEGIEQAVTEKTVAIMIVHPFGMVSTSLDQIQKLRVLAAKHNLDLWEDCAECFTGFGEKCYLGSEDADVRFFSFGMIKTATALGGGIAIFRKKDVAQQIQRLQYSLCRRQSTIEFFKRVVLSLVLNAVAISPHLFGFLVSCCSIFGIDYNNFVTRAIRGFPVSNASISYKGDRVREAIMRQQIRKQPSPALLALLLRRFKQSTRIAPSVAKRLARCTLLDAKLRKDCQQIMLPNPPTFVHTYWAFPVFYDNREYVSSELRNQGFDVVSWASQLCTVSKFEDDNRLCPRAARLMNQVLYLPISSQPLPAHCSKRLLASLQRLLVVSKGPSLRRKSPRLSSNLTINWAMAVSAVVLSVAWKSLGWKSIQLLQSFGTFVAVWVSGFFGIMVLFFHFLRRSIANLYLHHESWFQHFDMIEAATCDERLQNATEKHQVEGILAKNEVLQLPNVSHNFGEERKALLTGATGFVGSLLLRDLLFYRKQLSMTGGVILVCRSRGKVSAKERIASLLSKPMFSFLSNDEKDRLIEVVEGDVTQPSVGLSETDISRIVQDDALSHVFHAAAAVSFTQELPEAAKSIISSTLAMHSLASKLKRGDVQFVHISTAFIHGNKKGSTSSPLKEDLFPLDPYDPEEIYRSMLGSQFYATKAMTELGFPNTYAFSKCVCEHLLLERSTMNTLIIRPSIVGPAVTSPFEGWAGGKPSTLVAASMLYLSVPWNIWHLPNHSVAYIPVDVLCRFILSQAYSRPEPIVDENSSTSTPSSSSSFQEVCNISEVCSEFSDATSSTPLARATWQQIKTATMRDSSREDAMFTWLDFGIAQCHLAVITGSVSRAVAQFALFIAAKAMPSTAPSSSFYHQLHTCFIQRPIRLLVSVLNWLNYTDGGLGKISPFLELPLLFFPFVKEPFHFQTDLVAGDDFDAKRYAFGCGVAAHRFLLSFRSKKTKIAEKKGMQNRGISTRNHNIKCYPIGGRRLQPKLSDSLWAISQPRGSYLTRLTGMLFRKILRRVADAVTVDLLSFRQISAVIRAAEEDGTCIILAPTHRSFFDFLLLSYLFFSVPELRLDIPFIIAASEFEQLPLIGILAHYLRAIFIRRGNGTPENGLSTKLATLKKQNSSVPGSCIEVFLEGKRSRDRRFLQAKTGVLKSLAESGSSNTIIPITVNYEAIPEQNQLSDEAAGSPRQKLSLVGLLVWLQDVLKGNVSVGKVHISAGIPIPMKCQQPADFRTLVTQVQLAQQSQIHISDYHVNATARMCKVDEEKAREALEQLGCTFWPVVDDERFQCNTPNLPNDESTLCTVVLQCSHLLAPLFIDEFKMWSMWLNSLVSENDKQSQVSEAIRPMYDTFRKYFIASDKLVEKTIVKINRRGYQRPNENYILQIAATMNDENVPPLFIRAAISMTQMAFTQSERKASPPPESLQSYTLSDSMENLGFWGFQDSGFVLKNGRDGQSYVSMKGKRYGLCGKPLSNILPFMESEMRIRMAPLREFASNSIVWQIPDDGKFTDAQKQNLAEEFSNVSFATIDRVRHGSGHSQEDIYLIRTGGSFRIPDAVIWPQNEDDIDRLIAISKRLKYCLIPFGGGTNVSSATRCPTADVESRPIISVDMKKMQKILWVNEEDGIANVEAGMTGREIAEELGRRGWTMGHEPDSFEFSTLGGWIATKASGMKRNRYGNIEDIVKSVRVVGVNGKLWNGDESGKTAHGRVAEGFDLCSLMIGSEGCLGIIVSAVIRIWPLPEVREHDSVILRNFEDGLQFMRAVERLGAQKPVSVRLLDNAHFRLGQALRPTDTSIIGRARKVIVQLSSSMQKGYDYSLVVCATVSYEGTVSEVNLQKKLMREVSAAYGGMMLGSEIGKAGYDLTFMIAYLRDFAMTYHLLGESFETFVPWSRVGTLVRETKNRILREHQSRLLPGLPFVGSRVTQLYHEGVCVYFYLCFSFEGVNNASAVFSELEKAARDEILKHGGSLSHHHGIGKIRAGHLKEVTAPTLSATIGAIKKAIDSDNIFGARNGPFAHA
mmetsp:Transcript_40059/g.96714  ORF Transcript_40059/g.96714 Transcript_40059/m.96714 type:complete len:2288 (-) Transcript_40059:1058-7921(-)